MFGKFLAAAMAVAALSTPAAADNLHGTWLLVSSINDKDGVKKEQFGAGAQGMMILDPRGRFMLTIIGAGLPKFASNNRAAGTAEENKAVVSKSIALFGRYAHDPAGKTITLKIEQATFPNWNATEQKRIILAASKDELKYQTPQASGGGTGIVTWKRAD